jgi:ubiquitin-like-conjugating enzyme ATG10
MSYRESSLPRSRLTAFPQLTTTDFEEACTDMVERFRLHGCKQNDWQSVEMKSQLEMIYLRVIKTLSSVGSIADELQHDGDDELGEDNDDEALETSQDAHALIHYDILLSPVYRVPVLYINVSDLRHRYPPTMATLYQHVISAPFKAQTESGGVMGGITISVSIP